MNISMNTTIIDCIQVLLYKNFCLLFRSKLIYLIYNSMEGIWIFRLCMDMDMLCPLEGINSTKEKKKTFSLSHWPEAGSYVLIWRVLWGHIPDGDLVLSISPQERGAGVGSRVQGFLGPSQAAHLYCSCCVPDVRPGRQSSKQTRQSLCFQWG